MGHKINAGASVLAGLGRTFIYINLTAVTRIASWTLYQGKKGIHSAPQDTDMPGIPVSTQNPTTKGHTDVRHTARIGGRLTQYKERHCACYFLCV